MSRNSLVSHSTFSTVNRTNWNHSVLHFQTNLQYFWTDSNEYRFVGLSLNSKKTRLATAFLSNTHLLWCFASLITKMNSLLLGTWHFNNKKLKITHMALKRYARNCSKILKLGLWLYSPHSGWLMILVFRLCKGFIQAIFLSELTRHYDSPGHFSGRKKGVASVHWF